MTDAPSSDAILARLLDLHPKMIDLTLDRVWALLSALDHPERRLPPVVHVAGTNGKGSTVAMLRAGLEGAGETVHAYTSPHLARFHERIRIAGSLVSEADLSALLEECEKRNGGAPITFFEITTCAALLAYARTPADWLLLEVGLGGRLDATNVVETPALTVITPISFDHQQYLGETIAEIAFEKAGILKTGALCVVGPQRPEALAVIEARAAEVGAPLSVSGRDWTSEIVEGALRFSDAAGTLTLPIPNLPGAHQAENAGAALAGLRALGFDEAACRAAVTQAEWPARLQRLKTGPLAEAAAAGGVELWLDGGHNEAAGEVVAAYFRTLEAARPAPLHVVCGMLETKDPDAFLGFFRGLARRLETVAIPEAQASWSAEALAEAGRRVGLDADPADSVSEAVARAISGAGRGGRALICGSLYLSGFVLRENG
jgi:dihydrofolate synthase/folylpolyglutamate synthase